ncbi:MAG: cysteine desulfuration protein SufE [Methanolobus sp.]|nr:cysteine desulfuration protein SufE [Methanolobus sp.]
MRDVVQDEIIKQFEGLEWLDRYALLISFAKALEPMDAKFRIEENSISGCQSRVWIISHKEDGRLVFHLDSEAMITRGIMALLLKVVNNRSPREIMDLDLYFIEEIGLKSNLSPARADGLASIIRRIREVAEGEVN